ncbi:hypothetical protein MAR_016730 [Mya arenaria]|uniref:Uncharacterized protein n=1 Tax=Mya arenaria TaxID=6604 RepID=A0ABY7E9R3_MYAAR|nr:CLK4-associating serine/arginine rich protein-like [Mya arenaria]WAR06772.1 hypothetical protein MAR_016730 [Mya arenaria]
MKISLVSLLLVACVYVQHVTSGAHVTDLIDEEEVAIYSSNQLDYVLNKGGREKRALPAIPVIVGVGVRAIKALKDLKKARDAVKAAKEAKKAKDKLLKDTKPSPTNRNPRVQQHRDAKNDPEKKFDSLKPKDVKSIKTKEGVNMRVGKVGDNTVKVRDRSGTDQKGPPTIDMHKTGVKAKARITTKVRFDKPTKTPEPSGKKSGGGLWGGGSKKSSSSSSSSSKSDSGGSKKSGGGGGWWRRRR